MSGTSLAGADFWSRHGLRDLLAVLNGGGEEARVVGGAVRNTLLGRPVTDVDIATTALPQVVSERVRGAGMKPVPTGIDHGTVTVVVDHEAYEVTTLREDMETDGRRAVVRFGRSWAHDAARRDFTINALYASPDGMVVDLVGGLADLAARRVRFIGDAENRIREDYLRILRLFRFHAAYGEGPVDVLALHAAIRCREGLRGLSHERVRAELLKLLLAPGAAHTLHVMSDCGLIQPLLAGLADVGAFSRLVAREADFGVAPDAIRRLAALALRVADDVPRLREKLRLSNVEMQRLFAMASSRPALPAQGAPFQAQRAFVYRAGAEAALDRALLAAARGRADMAPLVALATSWAPPRLPVAAADLLAGGLKPGPGLGRALAYAENAWVDADFPGGNEARDALIQAALGTEGVGG
ncbi:MULTISPECIES: CCA tRNA nucleotidyltransferase [unclassified Xanthobacter]|uniref:CCA tRNA nucleotidyltransferase n=1 Tax=unclassified Xanthobacter TaxID=2623496 RepID=UPI001F1DCD8F|nr:MULTISPECIES: CCA tRNA nucleotidyltransferase [unclassified Xanthobacter]